MYQAASQHVLVLVFLLLALIISIQAVQLGDLVGNRMYFGSFTLRSFSDGTLLATGFSGLRNYLQLQLDPVVTVPKPRQLSSTILLARIHSNSTVVWATAITTMSIDVGIDVDPADNVYAVAPPVNAGFSAGTLQVIKYAPSGIRIYAKYNKPPGNVVIVPNRDKETLSFVKPNTLLLQGLVERERGPFPEVPGIATFNARNGQLVCIRQDRIPRKIDDFTFGTSAVVTAATRKGQIACYAFQGSKDAFHGKEKLYARCQNLEGDGPVRTRKIASVKGKNDFFHMGPVVMEEMPTSKRAPSLFVTYERVVFLSRRKSVHTLFVRRLDSESLEDVNWASGARSGTARPIIMSLPEAHPEGNSHTTFLITMRYSKKVGSVAVLLWTGTPFVRFKQQGKNSGTIKALGNPAGRLDPTQYWIFFFDKKQQLSTRLLNTKLPGRVLLGLVRKTWNFLGMRNVCMCLGSRLMFEAFRIR